MAKLTELETLTSQLLTFLEQIAGARLHARHRHSALLQLTETLLAVLRERGKTSPLICASVMLMVTQENRRHYIMGSCTSQCSLQ